MQRLVCLDGVRGALAVYVMLSHMAPFAAMPAWLAHLLSHGGAGVDVFFILSGLVIVRSLESCRWQAQPFLIARVWRILPAYLLVLILAIAVQPLPVAFDAMPWIVADSPAHSIWSQGWPVTWAPELLAHLTMTHGLFPDGVLPDMWVSFLGAAWSLSTEWQFYGLVLLAGRAFGGKVPHLISLFLILGLAGLVWQAAAPAPWHFSRAFLPNKAEYFALGIASALAIRDRDWQRYGLTLAAVMAVCGCWGGAEKLLPPLAWTLCLAAQCGVPGSGFLARTLSSRPVLWFGSISYCLYLVNEPLQKPLGIGLAWLAAGDGRWFSLLWVPLAIVIPVVVAAILYYLVERPAQNRGRHAAHRRVVRPGRWIAVGDPDRASPGQVPGQ
jgi:peptidoglycan/LPS O-acetylase OafA/YrhL